MSRDAQAMPWPGRTAAPSPAGDMPFDDGPDASADGAPLRAARRRARWLMEVRVTATGYAMNGLFLGLFALAGTVPWSAAALMVLPGWLACAVSAHLIASGRSSRWADPAIANVQAIFAMVSCGVGLWLYPAMTFLYVLILFMLFLWTTYRMPPRRIHLTWVAACTVIGLATLTGDRVLQLPHATVMEQVLTWAAFTTTLARCVLLSVFNTSHNLLLRRRGEQMAETLAEIERLANFDELTGLPNRRNVLRTLDDELARCQRDGTPLAVALLDLDHFKAVNDTRGHLVGDRTLRAFAAAVQAHRRATDTFGRQGGEEFLLVLPATRLDEALQALARLRAGVAAADWAAVAPGLHVTFSAGVAVNAPGDTAAQLLSRADLALYEAKHAGRDCHRAG